ncbi:hypothetical protein [Spirosoma validum]|uniref:Uncharacterized protein n=1 Tax=Spirosoma validum TaxID=2771355 RepID=A0A927B8R0_9BACT|nr:hypothetical protein [Spirosoma validum]MBD2757212.1 hypothetical protein [Spirosoma validum]
MKAQITLTIWTGAAYGAIKRVVIPYEEVLDVEAQMNRYAEEHGLTLALIGEDGKAGLYWDADGKMIRLAAEELSTSRG